MSTSGGPTTTSRPGRGVPGCGERADADERDPIGTVNLYDTEPRAWDDEELEIAALLANMTAGHVMMARSLADSRALDAETPA